MTEVLTRRASLRSATDSATVRSPIFILCTGRSFSSVVCCAIGQHPQLYDLPEMYLFVSETIAEVIEMSRRRGSFIRDGLLRVIAQLRSGEQTIRSVEDAFEWIMARSAWSTGEMYRYIRDALAPLRCVDKTPLYARPENLERLYATFPDAGFIHLSRHPKSTGRSIYKTGLDGRWKNAKPEAIELHWLRINSTIYEFTSRLPLGQCIRLKGEDLLTAPEVYLPQIAEWLELNCMPSDLEAMKHPENSIYAAFGPWNARFGHNRGFFKDPRLRIGAPAEESLEGAVDWLPGGRSFRDETVWLARQLGYT